MEFDRLAAVGAGAGDVSFADARAGAPVVGMGIAWINAYCAVEVGDGLIEVALKIAQLSAIVPGHGVARVNLERPVEISQRSFHLAFGFV